MMGGGGGWSILIYPPKYESNSLVFIVHGFIRPTCLILVLVTWILPHSFDFFMDTLLVSLKIVLTCCLISTLMCCPIFTPVTGIFDNFMSSLLASLKMALSCCLISTLITGIFYTFMNSLLVSLKIALLCCPIFTLVTEIFHTCMDSLLASLKMVRMCCFITTLLTDIHNSCLLLVWCNKLFLLFVRLFG